MGLKCLSTWNIFFWTYFRLGRPKRNYRNTISLVKFWYHSQRRHFKYLSHCLLYGRSLFSIKQKFSSTSAVFDTIKREKRNQSKSITSGNKTLLADQSMTCHAFLCMEHNFPHTNLTASATFAHNFPTKKSEKEEEKSIKIYYRRDTKGEESIKVNGRKFIT